MDSRDKGQTARHHPPHLSSLVVRPSASDGADGGGSGGRTTGNDYEPGEVRRDLQPYSRSNLYNDESGYRIRAGSSSPMRQRDADRRYGMGFDRSAGSSRSREYDDRREFGRYRDSSPPCSRRPGGRPVGRGFDGPGFGPRPLRGEGTGRNNPNVLPREGDWICPDTLCGNLNFARREYCNNCHRFRYAPAGSPRRGNPGPPRPHAPRRYPGPPLELSPHRNMNTYRSPPRSWERDGPRSFVVGAMPPVRHEDTFSPHMHRDRLEYLEDEYRRSKFDRAMTLDWGHGDHGRDGYFSERKGYERHLPSPPLAPAHAPFSPPRGRWTRDPRERSRSPVRGLPTPRGYRRDMFMERGRDGRRGGRNHIGDAY